MNRITLSFLASCSNTILARSSNSPRYFVPATRLAISSENTVFFSRILGTLPSVIINASPSAIAVLPTPGSPTIMTLFFLRLARTSVISISSSSLPMTGSISPSADFTLRLAQKSSNLTA